MESFITLITNHVYQFITTKAMARYLILKYAEDEYDAESDGYNDCHTRVYNKINVYDNDTRYRGCP